MARRLILGASCAIIVGLGACSGSKSENDVPPVPAPLPTAGIAGRKVSLYPVTLVVADATLGWDSLVGTRAEAIRMADSLIGRFLTERAPEVEWVLPAELRAAARRAPGVLTNPDRMGTAILRAEKLEVVPDPLRSQMRSLTAVAGDRYAAVPAALVFSRSVDGQGEALLHMVLADVRFGRVGWRSVARGTGDGPWSALWEALKTLVPDLP
jgi:hypothetical protein